MRQTLHYLQKLNFTKCLKIFHEHNDGTRQRNRSHYKDFYKIQDDVLTLTIHEQYNVIDKL